VEEGRGWKRGGGGGGVGGDSSKQFTEISAP
jgi:hypothetical protein